MLCRCEGKSLHWSFEMWVETVLVDWTPTAMHIQTPSLSSPLYWLAHILTLLLLVGKCWQIIALTKQEVVAIMVISCGRMKGTHRSKRSTHSMGPRDVATTHGAYILGQLLYHLNRSEIYQKSEHHVTYVNLKDSERMGSRWLKPSDHRCYLGLPRPDAARRIAAVSWASQIQAWRHTRQQWESGYDGNIISMDISAIRMGIQ